MRPPGVRKQKSNSIVRGEAGDRQVEGAKIGLTHLIGLGSACAIHILDKPA